MLALYQNKLLTLCVCGMVGLKLHKAYLLISSSGGNLLFEQKQINRSFVQLGDFEHRVSLLAMELVELVQVVDVCPRLALHRV